MTSRATTLPVSMTPLDGRFAPSKEKANLIGAPNNRLTRDTNRPRSPFDSATARVIENGEALKTERLPMSRIRVVGDRIFAGEAEFLLDSEGRRRLCSQLKAPAVYLESISTRLRDELLAYHLGLKARDGGRLGDHNSRLVHREGRFVDLGRADLYTLGAGDVLNAVRDGFGNDSEFFEVQDLDLDDETAFSMDIVSLSVATEIRRGDVVQAGVRIEHSYIGERATTVLPFAVRLLCTNGSIYRECLGPRETSRTRRLNVDRQDARILQYQQVERLAKDARKLLDSKLDSIRKLANERAELGELTGFLRQARMHSAGLAGQLKHAWEVEGSEQTAFGLFNALTRLATHGSDPDYLLANRGTTELSRRQRGVLARLAGIYANRSTHICEKCFAVLNREARSGNALPSA